MTKLKLIEGGKVEPVEIPEQHHFECPECRRDVVMYPRTAPMVVQHSIPTCRAWQRIEQKKDDLERFLIKAGVALLFPPSGKA